MANRLDEYDPKRGRQGRPWRDLVDELCPPGSYCEVPVCKFWTRRILFHLRRAHPMSRSLHHLVSPLDGGHPTDPANLVPAHLGCNSSIGRPKVDSDQVEEPPRRSRDFPSIDPRWL